jgi:hypothetical protein
MYMHQLEGYIPDDIGHLPCKVRKVAYYFKQGPSKGLVPKNIGHLLCKLRKVAYYFKQGPSKGLVPKNR